MRKCERCNESIVAKNAHARFCSSKCRVYAHRSQKTIWQLLNADRWVLRDQQKRPRTIDGGFASSTDPATWTTLANVKDKPAGFVLGDGYACIDLDHCIEDGTITAAAAEFIATYPRHYIEVSPSGTGLHIWGTANPGPGSRKTVKGLNVERYTTGRYITVTGKQYQAGSLLPL